MEPISHSLKELKRNKNKQRSRNLTNYYITKAKKIPIQRKCKKCGSFIRLEIHHKTYPLTFKKIKKAINEGRVYCLCKKCHKHYNRFHRIILKNQQILGLKANRKI
jgi:hypothetical protein